jgi:hypothetical protein
MHLMGAFKGNKCPAASPHLSTTGGGGGGVAWWVLDHEFNFVIAFHISFRSRKRYVILAEMYHLRRVDLINLRDT